MEKTPSQNRLVKYIKESFHELSKITWPTKIQAVNICILVVTFVFVAAIVFAGIDFLLSRGYKFLLELPVK